ncbi:HD domain-containing phosphohydrolase [Marinomonas posidonica]|uniref:Metal dependent phosphohydrolase n=1 Tax=Marinomonas posidonica (strain CECT 7376 / NCIMB 14433 / IVIA-Po-181) TaxID=491952 RepID=F6CV94_MARPP|nr:HD domain-containing phosphohydrolase [Marinomonas posidonica]AEF54204.1 metal dependent phosphohydrolase [Marinomonas posidonica IVIA-Po-181]
MSHFACKEFSSLEKELKDDLLECYVEAQQEIEEIINSIESDGFSFDKLDELFRSLHSMKGNCSVCFLDPLVGVLHKLEEIVDGMRGGYIQYHQHFGDLINVVIDKVHALLKDIYQSHVAESALRDLLQQGLDNIYAQEEDAERPELAAKLLRQCSNQVMEEEKKDDTSSLIITVEFTEQQQVDIDLFAGFSHKLNRLLGYSSERSERILKLCQLINAELREPVDPCQLSAAAYMHNMGMAVILNCKDDEEAKKEATKNHPMVGAKLLSKHDGWEDAVDIVKAHKERFDGTGYPEGLVGPLIPQGAFILSMAVMFIDSVWGKSGSEYNKSAMRAVQSVNFESGKGFPQHLLESFNAAIRKVLVAKRK